MFGFNKQKYTDKELGTFLFSGGLWFGEFNEIEISVDGNKAEPDLTSLAQLKEIISNIEKYNEQAINFINYEIEAGGSVKLEQIYSTNKEGVFDLSFGSNHEQNNYYVVHFLSKKPSDFSCGD